MAKPELDAFMVAHKISVRSEFVPFSQSRNAGEKHPSLNWRVTVERDGRDIITTDYMAGSGHCPAYKSKHICPGDKRLVVAWECEHGRRGHLWSGDRITGSLKEPILPDPCDVLCSLALDANVLDYSTFEDWASGLGYDPDSRKDEAIYRACLEIALKLRAAFGEDGLKALQEAAQDY